LGLSGKFVFDLHKLHTLSRERNKGRGPDNINKERAVHYIRFGSRLSAWTGGANGCFGTWGYYS
jgi:hypothetical protein